MFFYFHKESPPNIKFYLIPNYRVDLLLLETPGQLYTMLLFFSIIIAQKIRSISSLLAYWILIFDKIS